MLRRFLFLLFAVLSLGPPIFAQVKTTSITSSQCATMDVSSQVSTVGIQVIGTWTGTLQPQLSIGGQAAQNMQVTPSTSAAAQSTITANGVYQAKVAGGSTFLLCGATVATGTATVYLNPTLAMASLTYPTTVTLANNGMSFETIPCTSLNSITTNDAGCAAVFNDFILNSSGTTDNRHKHAVNIYYQGDLHQAASNDFYSLNTMTSILLDAGSIITNQRAVGFEPQVSVADLASSGLVLPNMNIIKARSYVQANAHVTNLPAILVYLPTFNAGSVTTNYWGLEFDAPTGTGTVTNWLTVDASENLGNVSGTNALGINAVTGTTANYTNEWGGHFLGKNGGVLVDDTTAAGSFIGHATGSWPTPFTLHDGWYSGTSSPEGVVTGAIGSFFSQRDGANGTSLWVKESGVSNIGWNPVQTGLRTANVAPVTVTANTTADQNLMTYTIPANVFNLVNRNLHVFVAGLYTTPAASVATLNLKAKLCTVSGCGSGTVISPCSFTSTANPGTVTNNPLRFTCDITTQTAGATASFEAHGEMAIDLGAAATSAASVFGDTNTTTVGTIDTTAQLFLQITGAFSVASASNSLSQRQLTVQVTN